MTKKQNPRTNPYAFSATEKLRKDSSSTEETPRSWVILCLVLSICSGIFVSFGVCFPTMTRLGIARVAELPLFPLGIVIMAVIIVYSALATRGDD